MYTKKSLIRQCVGITSATVLMTMTVAAGTSHAADLKANQVTSSQTTNNQDEVRQIVRTIKIDDPYKGMQTVKQVVEFKKLGSSWQATTPVFWLGYFAPNYDDFEPDTIQIEPKLITVNDKSETITIKYHPYQLSERESLQENSQCFYGYDEALKFDNKAVWGGTTVKVGQWFEVPTSPKEYELLLTEPLPKKLKMYHRGQLPIKVLVQPVQNHLKKLETRQIKRPIILNLPGGKKVVDQVIKLSREVTAINEHLNFYSNGPWKIEKEEKVEIPQVDFYEASMTQIPTFVIGESVKSVEINYSLVKKGEDSSQTGRVESQSTSTQTEGQKEQDSQTETPTISNNSVQTETNQHITDNSQQTDPEQLSNEDTQTTDTGKDNETQTTALSETSTQTQTEGSSGKSEETQTESNNKNENNQTEGLHSQSASSQTEELKEQISQTELPVASSEGVQTDLNKDRSDSAQQTDPKLVSNQETQVNLVGEHKGTQTHKLTKADEYTQSEERFCKSEGSQTEMIINSDNATQTERLVGELTTQIEQKEETDSPTQTVNKGQKENSSNPSQTMKTERMPKESYSETQNNSDNVDNTEKSFLDDSEIQKILDQDSKELKKLKGSSKHNKSVPNGKEKLPQTGNQTDNKTTIAGLGIISIITALTATFWKKKEKE